MKYRVGEPEKVTKDGRDYQVWRISEQAGFYLADGVAGEKAEELIDRIIASACALAVKMDAQEAPAEQEPEKQEQKTETEKLPYLVRRSNGERIVIDKEVFKLGKDAACADYVVDNNPTISRNHADIERREDGFYARDKGSLNHTFVDGKKVKPEEPVKLTKGSLLQLSDEVFEFVDVVNIVDKKKKKR